MVLLDFRRVYGIGFEFLMGISLVFLLLLAANPVRKMVLSHALIGA